MTEVKCALGVLTDAVNHWNQDHRLRLRFHGTTNEAWSGGRQCALSVWDVSNSDLLAWEVDAVTTDIELKVRIGIAPDDQARDAWAKIGQLSADTWGAIIEPVSAEASEGDDQQVAKTGLQDVDQIVIPLSFDEVDGMIIDAVPGGVHYTREMINPSTAVYRLSWSGMIYDKRVAYDDIGLIKLFKSGDKEAILSLKEARAAYDGKHLEIMWACQKAFLKRLLILLETSAAEEEETSAGNIRVPTKPAVLKRWRETWRSVKGMWGTTQKYKDIADWHNKTHPKLSCSVETMTDIIRAGDAGLLDK